MWINIIRVNISNDVKSMISSTNKKAISMQNCWGLSSAKGEVPEFTTIIEGPNKHIVDLLDRSCWMISIKMASHPCGGTIPNKPTQCVY